MKFSTRISISLLLLIGLGGAVAFAQFSSGIEGIVHDPAGAVIAKANVTITDTRLGVSKTVLAGDTGYFRFDGLAASTYSIEVRMSGFQTWKQNGLTLQIGEIRTITPELKIGSVDTQIEVSAAATSINLVAATTESIISSLTLQETPLSGQNIYGLASLTPGMTGGGIVTSGNDNYTNEYGINLNAAGLRQEENGYQIDDGYTNTPSRGGQTSISPNPEIVSSVEVRTNNFDAQKGRNAGATVNVYTNSGSNQFHGNIDWYFTNDKLEARTFNGPPSTFTRNEESATMGGPLLKNKLFWFGAIDVLREGFPGNSTATVETQDFVNWAKANLPNTVATGIFTLAPPSHFPDASQSMTVYDYLCKGGSPCKSGSAVGYYTPPAGIPDTLNVIGTANYSWSTPKNGYQWSFRIDEYLGKNDRLYGDVIRTNYSSPGNGVRPAAASGNANSADFVNINWTHTFSTHLINQTGVNMIRPYGSNLGYPADGIPYVNVANLQGFSNWAPGNFTQSTYSWRDVMTATIRTHTLKFGVDLFDTREVDHQEGAFTRPTYNFQNILDFVQDEAYSEDAPTVNLKTHTQAPYDRDYRDLIQGYYLQDDWKLSPRFTLNLGVRYDGMVNFFSIYRPTLNQFNLGSGSSWNASVASGVAKAGTSSHVLDHSVGGFTPRVGFSWDVFGKGRTALRGGFGMFEDQPPYLHITDMTATNLPLYYQPHINVKSGSPMPTFALCTASGAWNLTCPIADTSNVTINSSGGVLVDGVLSPSAGNMGGYDPNLKMQQVVAWSLSVQQQLKKNLILELNYSGTEAHHLLVFNDDINRVAGDLIQNKGQQKRLNSNFGTTQWASSNGNSFGNYGSAQIVRTFTHGLSLRGIYTYGKALDQISNASSISSQGPASTKVIQSNNLKAQRGRADFDIHQQFSADGTWDVPNNYSSRPLRYILGGWEFGGKWIGYTGMPFTVNTTQNFTPVMDGSGNVIGNSGGDFNADGTNYDVPNAPTFGRHLSGQSKKQFLKGIFGDPTTGAAKAAFPAPTLGEEGNLGRNTYDSPGYKDFDLTFEKYFNVPWFFSEKMKIEAKGEVLNLFNRSNLTSVTSDMSSSSFGQATSQLPPRSLQLHLRASF